MNRALAAVRLWELVGWLMLIAVVILSLVRIEQPVELQNADKYQHLLAYGSLMFWWGMVQPGRKFAWALLLPVLGLILEWAQSMTVYRVMEWYDAVANMLGVIVGLLLLATPAGRLLSWLDRKLANRLDSRQA